MPIEQWNFWTTDRAEATARRERLPYRSFFAAIATK
jgi:hypothetical protein